MKYLGKITDDKDLVTKEYVDAHSGGGGSKNIWYATCPTAASTTAKVVTTSSADFTLTTGNMVRVLFTYANSASAPTLAVDGTTATAVRIVSGTSGAQYHWQAGETVDFVYNGTYFLMVDRAPATTTYYGPTKLSDSTSSTSTALAATANAVKTAYDKANGLITYGTSGNWKYHKYSTGLIEMWYSGSISSTFTTSNFGAYRGSSQVINFPSLSQTGIVFLTADGILPNTGFIALGVRDTSSVTIWPYNRTQVTTSTSVPIYIYAVMTY